MDEIAKEYDVVVLGTGESEPKDPDFLLTFFFLIYLLYLSFHPTFSHILMKQKKHV